MRACRRKQREQKRYAKQVMAERVKEKVQAKKAGVASITKLRKQRQRDGFAGELDMDAELAGPGQRKPAMAPGQRIRPGRLACAKNHCGAGIPAMCAYWLRRPHAQPNWGQQGMLRWTD